MSLPVHVVQTLLFYSVSGGRHAGSRVEEIAPTRQWDGLITTFETMFASFLYICKCRYGRPSGHLTTNPSVLADSSRRMPCHPLRAGGEETSSTAARPKGTSLRGKHVRYSEREGLVEIHGVGEALR